MSIRLLVRRCRSSVLIMSVGIPKTNIGGFMKPLSAQNLSDISELGLDNIINPAGTVVATTFATTQPTTFIYDSREVSLSASTLFLGVSGNHLSLTSGSTTVSAVSGGYAGAVYYVTNKSAVDVTVQNNSKIFVRAGANLLLGTNQSCQMVCLSSDAVSVF
jgi:hypothetical protein